ncbi:hypothetical protein V8C44DRAFT_319356 [Trichoderma aethiopicum]
MNECKEDSPEQERCSTLADILLGHILRLCVCVCPSACPSLVIFLLLIAFTTSLFRPPFSFFLSLSLSLSLSFFLSLLDPPHSASNSKGHYGTDHRIRVSNGPPLIVV